MPVYKSLGWLENHIRGLYAAVLLVVIVVLVGTIGYCLIEGWSFADAIYMTIITLSTVGYSEVHPLSDTGRVFSLVLIVCGVGIAFYAWAAISQVVVEGELIKFRGLHKMQKRIDKLSEHIIVCGFGRLASIVATELDHAGESVVVIDHDPDRFADIGDRTIAYVEGRAEDDDTLKAAGIERAKTLLSLLPSDADNVYVTLSARDLNPNIKIIARAEGYQGERRLRRAGADQILAPYRVSGARVVQQLTRPGVSEFLEIASASGRSQLVLEEIRVPEGSPLSGKSLAASDLRRKTGAIIAAFIHPDGGMEFNPGGDSLILAGTTLIILGKQGSIESLNEML